MKNCQTCGRLIQDNEVYILPNGQEVCASCYSKISSETQKTEAFVQPSTPASQPVIQSAPQPVSQPIPAAPIPQQPPVPQYAYTGGKINKTNFWTGFLKVFAIIGLVLGILASIAGAVVVIVEYGRYDTGIAVVAALGIFIGGTLISLLTTSSVMVYLNLSSDISTIKAVIQELEQRNRR